MHLSCRWNTLTDECSCNNLPVLCLQCDIMIIYRLCKVVFIIFSLHAAAFNMNEIINTTLCMRWSLILQTGREREITGWGIMSECWTSLWPEQRNVRVNVSVRFLHFQTDGIPASVYKYEVKEKFMHHNRLFTTNVQMFWLIVNPLNSLYYDIFYTVCVVHSFQVLVKYELVSGQHDVSSGLKIFQINLYINETIELLLIFLYCFIANFKVIVLVEMCVFCLVN